MKRAWILALALCLGACASGRPREAERYFVLDQGLAGASPHAPATMHVAPTGAAGFYGTRYIVYSDAPGTRANYRYSFWTEQPQKAVHAALLARLGDAGAVRAPGRLELDTHLDEIYHDAATAPGVAHVAVTARLMDDDGALLAERRFDRSAAAASFDARGAVDGMRQALAAVLDDIDAWAQAQAQAQAAQATQAAQPGGAAAVANASSAVP